MQKQFKLPNPSFEQQQIINNLKNNNIIVNSVAGSGKTTTILHLANTFQQLKFLLLTYNAKLKLESRQKVQDLNIQNIEVHTYHSYCFKYYDNKCINDKFIEKILDQKQIKFEQYYDVIILDECQDMTPLYYQLVIKIYMNNISNNMSNKKLQTQLCLFGDGMQNIFQFNLADQRFLQYGDKIFNLNNYEWKICQLRESFRITQNMSQFINKCMLKYDKIISNKKSLIKVQYHIMNSFNYKKIFKDIIVFLQNNYKLQDIFILCPSVKGQASPVRQLANYLTENNIPIFVPISDEDKLDEQVLQDKIVFSTFHQVKGLERKIIIIYNFDESYFQYYNKNANQNICPNILYVATTRALEHLYLIHDIKYDFLPFLNQKQMITSNFLKMNCPKQKKKQKNQINNNDTTKINPQSVSNFIRFIPNTIINECMSQLEIIQLQKPQQLIEINHKTQQNDGYESICDINGIAIPTFYELLQSNKMTILQQIQEYQDEEFSFTKNLDNFIKNNYQQKDIQYINVEDILYLATRWQQQCSGYNFRIKQIQKYDWMNIKEMNLCIDNLKLLNIENSQYEKYVNYQLGSSNPTQQTDQLIYGHDLVGYIDCIDNKNQCVYEFKCKSILEDTDILQLAVYMYLIQIKNKNKEVEDTRIGLTKEYNEYQNYKYILYNILSQEKIEIKANINQLSNLIQIILRYKNQQYNDNDDQKFINQTLILQQNIQKMNETNETNEINEQNEQNDQIKLKKNKITNEIKQKKTKINKTQINDFI